MDDSVAFYKTKTESQAGLISHRFDYYVGLSHVNIAVDDIDEAMEFYAEILGAIKKRSFRKFKNIGFSRSAGFLVAPEMVEVSISFMLIPGANLVLELMQYHFPVGSNKIQEKNVYDVEGVKHIAITVNQIDKAYEYVKSKAGVRLINSSDEYLPFKIDEVTSAEVELYNVSDQDYQLEVEKVCGIVSNIRYFYFIDQYGVQWEFEQGEHRMDS